MKKINTLLFLILVSISASAQYNYYKLSIGGGPGITQSFTDVAKHGIKPAITTTLDFNINPFVSAGIEYQFGGITGGGIDVDPHQRFFVNKYSAIIANGKIQLAQVTDFERNNFLYAIRGLYLGTGVGFIKNNMSEIVRIQPKSGARQYVFPGVSKSTNLMIPANLGINIDITDRWGYTRFIFNVNYQFSVTFGEGLDGYNDPSIKFKNNNPDMYSFASASLKICFGPEGLY